MALKLQAIVLAAALCAGAVGAHTAIRPADMAAKPRVEVDYALHCQGCHLADGRGMAGKVPDLRMSLGRFLEVPGGRAYLVQVPGVATSRLDDEGTARLLNWLIARMGPPATCRPAPYTTAEVTMLRANWLRKARPLRESLLRQIAAQPGSASARSLPACPA
ncbi:hypothetical protein Saro_3822 (plasmid) [Novosphingobium aromaticivorans DSM 12444]|uniref:Cytochrome c, class I n=1 Tax=Novosphingobium aromaticivorans (strain ATCC 700278 / DSM 12444 / CCUG 56034 / CIP 105152 / NBRC 16084 / F199) TaxID=279238 RepID=A4XFH0_NOVAD|nr:hypothetical protein [Novosphingobium aromaticivorans]ABP64681.1 hypothetical protein Saro_3822 [Novosphingobium aromaticivorans DSM 12444]SCY80452.1 hypothetical protein SAMN05660666_02979 [Novosphingobium aromaticivorans]